MKNGLVNRIRDLMGSIGEDHVTMDVSQISDDIFVGTNACCQMHYTQLLSNKGVGNDLSLEGENVDAPYGVESYLWLPTPDHHAPTRKSLDLGVTYINDIVAHGGKVFIHCTNGHGRAPTMAAAWFISRGVDVEAAIEMVRRGRMEMHLEPEQKEALISFAT